MFFVNVDKEPKYPHKIYVIHNKKRLIHIFSQGECVYIKQEKSRICVLERQVDAAEEGGGKSLITSDLLVWKTVLVY